MLTKNHLKIENQKKIQQRMDPINKYQKPFMFSSKIIFVPSLFKNINIISGNPHVPPSTIVAKIMDCILQDDAGREEALMKTRHSIADMRTPAIHARLASRLHNNQHVFCPSKVFLDIDSIVRLVAALKIKHDTRRSV